MALSTYTVGGLWEAAENSQTAGDGVECPRHSRRRSTLDEKA